MNNESQKLDPEFKAKWVAALRSGEYKQAKGHLFINGGYCCLGVACRTLGIEDNEIRCQCYIYDRTISEHPSIPQILSISQPEADAPGRLLSIMNDEGKSFAEIADFIELNY